MALSLCSELLNDMQMYELKRLVDRGQEWVMMFAFPNSLYVFLPPFQYLYTVAVFSLFFGPVSYITGYALEKVHRRAGFLITAVLYVALSFAAFWLTILHIFHVPWSEAFS
jgi:hypothetical protein